MSNEDSLDIYIITSEKDLRLLRHFLTSYELFFHSKGKIYLWIWKKHEYLLRSMQLPKNLVLLFKDDVPELVEDDYRNQMYLKLMAHQYVESEWFWVTDTDYLITSPLCKNDFFSGEKPYWLYCDWYNVAEEIFRSGSEKFLGYNTPYHFLDQSQFILNKKILKNLSNDYDLHKILNEEYLAADQVVYGSYSYKNFKEMYQWLDSSTYNGPQASYIVNQRPPSFCELDEKIKLEQMPPAKYYIFWSYWEKAETKMVEFLNDAQLKAFGKIKLKPDETRLFRYWRPEQIDTGSFDGLDGVHLDNWLMQEVWCCLPTDHRNILQLDIMVPTQNPEAHQPLKLHIDTNSHQTTMELKSGLTTLALNLKKDFNNQIILRFDGGFLEPKANRTLYAKLEHCRLKTDEQ